MYKRQGLSYYRKFISKLASRTKAINGLLKKGVDFHFTAEHEATVRQILGELSGSKVLAFPDFVGAVSGARPFMLVTDASRDGLGAVVEQRHCDGEVRPLCFLSRSTLPNERNWTATELEAGAIVWAVKKNRPLFYGIPFQIYCDHQPLRNLFSLAEKVPRVQRWQDFLSAYTYKIFYKPGVSNSNADMLSRLPQLHSEEDVSGQFRLSDPADVDVYFIGASGVLPRNLADPRASRLDGLPSVLSVTPTFGLDGLTPPSIFQGGGSGRSDSGTPLTTAEVALSLIHI